MTEKSVHLPDMSNMLRLLCLLICSLFLLTACGSGDGRRLVQDNAASAVADTQHTCWQGDFISTFYKTLSDQTMTVFNNLTKENMVGVMALAFSIWLAFQVLRHVGSPAPESPGEFWTKVLQKGFLCALCAILVSSTDMLYYCLNNFVFPIYISLLEFASEIMKQMAADPAYAPDAIKIEGSGLNSDASTDYICEVFQNEAYKSGCTINATTLRQQMSSNSFPDAPRDLMSCMACAVSDRLSVGYNVAMRVLNIGTLTSFISGGFLLVCFTITKLGFIFYLVDSIFRLNIVILLLPFLIMFYPFEQTRKWSVTGFKVILNSAAIMLCLAVLISMTILAMQKMLIDPDDLALDTGFADKDSYTQFGMVALSFIFMGFAVIKITGIAVSLSDRLVGGGGGTEFQKKLQKLVATAAKLVFIAITAGAGKSVTALCDRFERLNEIRQKVNNAKKKAQKARDRLNALAGRKTSQQQEEEEQ